MHGPSAGAFLQRTKEQETMIGAQTQVKDEPRGRKNGGLASVFRRRPVAVLLAALVYTLPAAAQHGAKGGEWRFYGGDGGSTRYSALDLINRGNVKNLKIAWRWKTDNFGPTPELWYEPTPLMVK